MKNLHSFAFVALLLLVASVASGQSTTARRLAPSTFTNLGNQANGSVRYCTNCQATSPCTGGGSGAAATRVSGAWNCSIGSDGAGTGTVTSVSVVTANGVSGSVATSTTTPAITLTLGAIAPATSVTSPFFVSTAADPADAGVFRLGNTQLIEWENSTPGTDLTLGVNASNILASSVGITAPTFNGNTLTTGTYTLTGGASKTLTFNNSLTLAGTDSTTMTFPSTSATIARTDAANTFTDMSSMAGNANSFQDLALSNSTAGTAAGIGVSFTGDADGGSIRAISSAFTPSGDTIADSFQVRSFSTSSGGLQLAVGGANPLTLWSNGVERVRINNAGITSLYHGASIASATAIVLTGNGAHITGTTNITSITATGVQAGTTVTLIFDGVLTFTDGNNLKLAGNFVTTADDSITLYYDGTNFYEVTRAIN